VQYLHSLTFAKDVLKKYSLAVLIPRIPRQKVLSTEYYETKIIIGAASSLAITLLVYFSHIKSEQNNSWEFQEFQGFEGLKVPWMITR